MWVVRQKAFFRRQKKGGKSRKTLGNQQGVRDDESAN